ncbi:hypothetical protein CASFOL_036090 [Castilleja foliolosa]|uniref:Sodium channel modifier 1 n=1 Tax=Castilleja foliolosa TaxID=1961234 RepID=A0ABD3BUJ9_9LAMI
MSVFGGDSWAREAQCRKRRIDDLLIEGVEASTYKKLSNGKLTCLVCPNNPVLDTPIMLSTHVNGSRHRAAELRRKDRDLAMQEEVKKRLALSDCVKQSKITGKKEPLIERAKKAVSEVFHGEKPETGNLVMPHIQDRFGNTNSTVVETVDKGFVGETRTLDYYARLERELKFTASGWKRDGHGRWFKDENVEFDSDEEDPNIVLNEST